MKLLSNTIQEIGIFRGTHNVRTINFTRSLHMQSIYPHRFRFELPFRYVKCANLICNSFDVLFRIHMDELHNEMWHICNSTQRSGPASSSKHTFIIAGNLKQKRRAQQGRHTWKKNCANTWVCVYKCGFRCRRYVLISSQWQGAHDAIIICARAALETKWLTSSEILVGHPLQEWNIGVPDIEIKWSVLCLECRLHKTPGPTPSNRPFGYIY